MDLISLFFLLILFIDTVLWAKHIMLQSIWIYYLFNETTVEGIPYSALVYYKWFIEEVTFNNVE